MIKKIAFACTLFSPLVYGSMEEVAQSDGYALPSIPTLEEVSIFTGDYFTTPILSHIPYAADQIGTLVGNIFIYPFIPPTVLEEEIRFAKIASDPMADLIASDPLTKEINAKFQRSYEEIVLEEFGLKTTSLILEYFKAPEVVVVPVSESIEVLPTPETVEVSQVAAVVEVVPVPETGEILEVPVAVEVVPVPESVEVLQIAVAAEVLPTAETVEISQVAVAAEVLPVSNTVTVSETKPTIPVYNLVFFTGNLSLAEISQDLRPFARAVLEEKGLVENIAMIRLIAVSSRDMEKLSTGESYLPMLSETGYLHKNVLDKLIEKYGPIDQVVAYSLGCAVAAQVMTAIEEAPSDKYPTHWWLHVAPSSLEEVSKNYWGGRAFLWPGAKLSGWDVDLVHSLETYALNNRSSFIGISGLVESLDYYFPGKAGLCNHPRIKELVAEGYISNLVLLKPSRAESPQKSFHSLPLDYYDLVHMIDPETNDFIVAPIKKGEQKNSIYGYFIQPGEHLARSILRSSLPK